MIDKKNTLQESSIGSALPRRWTPTHSPLKISYWFGSPDAPPDIKQLLEHHDEGCRENLRLQEKCVLLTWANALAVLNRVQVTAFEFHPDDYDWQVNGWKIGTLDLLLGALSEEDIRRNPHLSLPPSQAEIFAEVMVQYSRDIDQMEQTNPRLFQVLLFERHAWVEPALLGLNIEEGELCRLDVRVLFRRLFEITTTGTSNLNPFISSMQVDEEQQPKLAALLGANGLVQ